MRTEIKGEKNDMGVVLVDFNLHVHVGIYSNQYQLCIEEFKFIFQIYNSPKRKAIQARASLKIEDFVRSFVDTPCKHGWH